MFTTPCFIRKNTPELREKLEKLGYKAALNGHGEWFIPMDELPYLETFPRSKSYMGRTGYWNTSVIDCGTNEELFLALAALRDDSDSHQYFIFTKDVQMGPALHKEGDLFYSDSLKKVPLFHLRKATADDIIEHFTMEGLADKK